MISNKVFRECESYGTVCAIYFCKTFLDPLNRGPEFKWSKFKDMSWRNCTRQMGTNLAVYFNSKNEKKKNKMCEIARDAHDKVIDLFLLALKEDPGNQPW
jgi:hypothetical protein